MRIATVTWTLLLLCGRVSASSRLHVPPECAPQRRSSGFEVTADMRIELLGVLHQLAFPPAGGLGLDPHRRAVDARFKAFREHPAVQRLREAEKDRAHVLQPFYDCLDPRTLQSRANEFCPASPLLEALPSFVASSGFVAFHEKQAPMLRRDAERVRAGLRPADPGSAFERYVGEKTSGGVTLILSRLLPERPAVELSWSVNCREPGSGRYALVKIVSESSFKDGQPSFHIDLAVRETWEDMSYLFFSRVSALLPGREALRRRLEALPPASCDTDWRKCVQRHVGQALADRLQAAAGVPVPPLGPSEAPLRVSLAKTLSAYEKGRDRYPAFADFLPQLLLNLEKTP